MLLTPSFDLVSFMPEVLIVLGILVVKYINRLLNWLLIDK